MTTTKSPLSIFGKKDILSLRRKILDQSLNVRETEAQVNHNNRNIGGLSKKKGKKDIFIRNLEIELERSLGTKVGIVPRKKGGKLVITYYSDDDLERIRTMLIQKVR